MLTGVESVKGIGQKKAALMHELGIYTLEDMLRYYPFSYEDRSRITPIDELAEGGTYYISGTATRIIKSYAHGRRGKIFSVVIADATGTINVTFFNAGYYAGVFSEGQQYNLYGMITRGRGGLQMTNPKFEKKTKAFEGAILPVYRAANGVTQKDLRKVAAKALERDFSIYETLPQRIVDDNRLCSIEFALRNIHFPNDKKSFAAAKYRLIFEELFFMQAGLFIKGNARCREESGIAFPHDNYAEEFSSLLGFEMTSAQKRVLHEIILDMESAVPMQRLVQGDVGSGKTAVAAAALYKAARDGWQGVLMAPTELLARQHYETFQGFFEGTGIRTGFLSSGLKESEKRETIRKIESHELDVVIGTHAVLQDSVSFGRLGLVITDEQHRFGVEQRVKLASKGSNPDILVMTATPIPRTLAVIIFGDLDISVIDELPPGRMPVKTKALSVRSRKKVYSFARELVAQGRQVYAVAPLIADSESVDAVSAEALYERLSREYPDIRIGLVHGGMKQTEKDEAMKLFAAHETDILVATVVIEVGINVPNACVMIIENAERFGLAQLHQLRGRVGRGSEQSYCFLLTDPSSKLGQERAKVIAESSDGFMIAEKDLEMRGPGDFFGTRQHGLPALGIADLTKHVGILNKLRPLVKEILQDDPGLIKPENKLIADGVRRLFGSLENLGI